jgi:hypothetical protein
MPSPMPWQVPGGTSVSGEDSHQAKDDVPLNQQRLQGCPVQDVLFDVHDLVRLR